MPTVDEAELPAGLRAPFGCPDCGGTLWEIDRSGVETFRCRIGHAYTPRHLLDAQGSEVENALWQAFRALEEQAAMARRLGNAAREEHRERAAQRFEKQERTARHRAETIRSVLERTVLPLGEDGRDALPEEGTTQAAVSMRTS